MRVLLEEYLPLLSESRIFADFTDFADYAITEGEFLFTRSRFSVYLVIMYKHQTAMHGIPFHNPSQKSAFIRVIRDNPRFRQQKLYTPLYFDILHWISYHLKNRERRTHET